MLALGAPYSGLENLGRIFGGSEINLAKNWPSKEEKEETVLAERVICSKVLTSLSLTWTYVRRLTLKGLFLYKPFSTQDWINQTPGQALTSCNRDFVGGLYPPKLISVFFRNRPSRWRQSSSHVRAVWPKALGIADQVRRGHWIQISSLSLRHQGWNMLAGPAKYFSLRTFNLGICGRGNLSTVQRSMESLSKKTNGFSIPFQCLLLVTHNPWPDAVVPVMWLLALGVS